MTVIKDDVKDLKSLGSRKTDYVFDVDPKLLETFLNKFPGREYVVHLDFPEFTSLCPKTGQPDFATIEIEYCPDKLCIESKSLKLYFFSYRQCGSFMETITNQILQDLVAVCSPRWMCVTGKFNSRGGIVITVGAEYYKPEEKGGEDEATKNIPLS